MRSQMPVYVNKALTRSMSTGNGIQNNNYDVTNRRNLIRSSSSVYNDKMPEIKDYKIQKVNEVDINKNSGSINQIGNTIEEKVPELQ